MPKSLLEASESEGWPSRSTIPWNVTPANGFGNVTAPDVNGAIGQLPRNNHYSSRNSRSSHSPPTYYPVSQPGAIGTASNNSPRAAANHADETALTAADPLAQLPPFDAENQQFNVTAFSNNNSHSNHLNSGLQWTSLSMADPSLGVSAASALPFDIPSAHRTHTPPTVSTTNPSRQSTLSTNVSLGSMHTPFSSGQPSRHTQASLPATHNNRQSMSQFDLAGHMARLETNDGNRAPGYIFSPSRPQFQPRASFDLTQPRSNLNGARDDVYAFNTISSLRPDTSPRDFASPPNESNHAIGSPFYSNHETQSSTALPITSPPYRMLNQPAEDQAEALELRLRSLQRQQQQDYTQSTFSVMPPAYRMLNHQNPDISHLAGMFVANPLGRVSNGVPPRGPSADQEASQVLRSPLLHEFRSNSKGNKRYELKDIYGHIVEFCGDQHGSRFIQQKLEGANSDEKERVFQEIKSNSLQLMMDLFGNYVIQKLFEHGNQAQKKALAQQMMTHILHLSLQMYGCRVVQKALEHVLTDQQAAMVKELEHSVLRCVNDQNGNHVIQKAIERVPMEHIQFIINDFKGQIGRYAVHPYGCRVIQRMLEHCNEQDRRSILSELYTRTESLIPDQFGNYVIQHVIARGQPEDRSKVISVVMTRLVEFSKHKFASNVVEKSIQFGSDRQRSDIIRFLITKDHSGDCPLSILIRDQFANYVVQKLLGVNGPEHRLLVDETTYIIQHMNRQQSAKQIAAIEKVLKLNPATTKSPSNHSLDVDSPQLIPLGKFDLTAGLDLRSNSIGSINASVLNSPSRLSTSASSASRI